VPDIAAIFPLPNSKLPTTGKDVAEQVASWMGFVFNVIIHLFTDISALATDVGSLAQEQASKQEMEAIKNAIALL
jgi:hypothetical protein